MDYIILAYVLLAAFGATQASPSELMGTQLAIFGALGNAIKGAVKGVGKIASAAAPVVGLIPGVGTLAAAGIGAGGQLLQGNTDLGDIARAAAGGATGGLIGGGGNLGQIAMAALPAITAMQGAQQADRDSAQARALTTGAVDLANQNAARANAEWAAGAGMRDAFRSGAMTFGDPTNPFSATMQGGIGAAAAPVAAGPPPAIQQMLANAANVMNKTMTEGEKRPRDSNQSGSSKGSGRATKRGE